MVCQGEQAAKIAGFKEDKLKKQKKKDAKRAEIDSAINEAQANAKKARKAKVVTRINGLCYQ